MGQWSTHTTHYLDLVPTSILEVCQKPRASKVGQQHLPKSQLDRSGASDRMPSRCSRSP